MKCPKKWNILSTKSSEKCKVPPLNRNTSNYTELPMPTMDGAIGRSQQCRHGSYFGEKEKGGRLFFHIELKSIEFVLAKRGRTCSLQVIEWGRNNILLSKEVAQWFCLVVAEVLTLPPDHIVFKSCWEAEKVFVVQKNRNDQGRYIAVMKYEAKINKGSVILPEGQQSWE